MKTRIHRPTRLISLCLFAALCLVFATSAFAGGKALQPATSARSGPLGMSVLPQHTVLKATTGRDLNVVLRLQADNTAPGARPPLDLAVVIDRSGSMSSGGKIQQVKQAALNLIDRLGRDDRVTLVSYDHIVTVHGRGLPPWGKGRDRLRHAILGMQPGGMTALGPALVKAIDALRQGQRGTGELQHVLLLSDGLANTGESRPPVIAARAAEAWRHGISVSTLGVGLDYNEDLMTRVADHGGGRYHFIKEAREVSSVLADELDGLSATVARGVEIAIRPGRNTRVVQVFGYPFEVRNDVAIIPVGSLRSGQSRDIVVRLAVEPGAGDNFEVAAFMTRFRAVAEDGKTHVIDAPLTVALSDDDNAVRASEDTEVTVRVADVESATSLEEAARDAEAGDFDQARVKIRGSIDDLRAQQRKTPSPRLEKKIKAMEEAEAGISAARGSASGRKSYIKAQKAQAYSDQKL